MEPSQQQVLAVAGAGTALATIVYTTPLATLAGTAAGLGSGQAGQAWILSSMSLGVAVAMIPAGALGDAHGRRRVFVAGALLLAATAVVAAVAPSTAALVLARIGHGLGAGALLACGLGLVGHAFPAGPERVRATGIWGACLGVGISVGPLLAAGLEVLRDWRAAYWLIAVLAVALAAAALRWLPSPDARTARTGNRSSRMGRSRGPSGPVAPAAPVAAATPARAGGVDLPGTLLLGSALAALLAGLVLARTGGPGPAVALLGAGAVLVTAFALVEARRRRPLLDLRLFRRSTNPDLVGATVAALANGAGVIAAMSFLPTVLQRGLGRGVLLAAVVLLAWSATSAVAALLARHLPDRFSPRAQLVAGLLGVAAGLVLLTGLDGSSGPARLLPGLLLAGLASGVLNAALPRQAVASMPPGLASVGSAINNTGRFVGAAVGITAVALLAAHPAPAAIVAGWDAAVLVTAAISVLGAVAVATCRPLPDQPSSGVIAGSQSVAKAA
ncbi:MFS transporter [Pseudonocardia sp.]|uniref:MFS transporter n=1 Tax=Pseudonocardia sp. TaxID=60912 RepID=UPI003D148C43